jgi:multidrug efflux pump subunit AcrA (membrane-fusion protein)
MFAEIGLGTDPRNALLAPADGVVHVGRTDYLLVATPSPDVWRVTPVEVGELREGQLEIVKGLKAGDRVLGQGTILLKPAIVASVGSSDFGPAGGVK